MKKWLVGLLVILVFSLLAIYIFIPGKIKISGSVLTACDNRNVSTLLHDQQKWKLWWPAPDRKMSEADSSFIFRDGRYKLTKPLGDGGEIQLIKGKTEWETTVSLFPLNKTSTSILWQTSFAASLNPIKRMAQYREAFRIKKDMMAILESFRLFADKTENIYGISVKRDKVKIDFMVSTKKGFSHYPTTPEVYEMIGRVQKYIFTHGANGIDHPMLSILARDSMDYEAHVAIPVDRKLPEDEIFSFKWMPKGGNILISPIQGGVKTIEQAQKQFDTYVTDHQLTVMAIPFQSLVTDRMNEPDSSKWITWLYYPVM